MLRGGQGKDILAIPDADFAGTRRLLGGNGTDTLRLDSKGLTLDFTAINDNRIVDMEAIELGTDAGHTLILTALEVRNLSSHSNTLTIHGSGSVVRFLDGDWSAQVNLEISGTQFQQYTNGSAVVNVQTDIKTNFAVIDLESLNGNNGFRIAGIDERDYSGGSVSNAGDVNGDGFDDIIIGAFKGDPGGNDDGVGESYVAFGRSDSFTNALDLNTLDGSNGFRIDGIDKKDYSGGSVSSAGDVNGDGFDDIFVGAHLADFAGESYVVFGKSDIFTSSVDLSMLNGTNGFRIDGIDSIGHFGRSVSSAGDINGDGFDDIIMGAFLANAGESRHPGESYVVFGRSAGFTSSLDLSTLDGSNGFQIDGIDEGDRSGRSVSSAGDVNGDGFDDIIIGASNADPDGIESAGESYVVFGKSAGFISPVDLSALDGTNGIRIDGIDSYDRSGSSVSGAGDVNGDGFDDIIVGATHADPSGTSGTGGSYVVFGRSSGFSSSLNLDKLDGSNGFRIDGIDSFDLSGLSVSNAGDVNGDGFDDVLIGAYNGDPGGDNEAGESYVVFGKSSGFSSSLSLSTLSGSSGFRIDGIDESDHSGNSVSNAGDVNGDGFDDIIIGAYTADSGGVSRTGESYVVFGGNFTGGTETQMGDSGANTLTANQGTSAIDILIGGLGDDRLVSDGGSDVLRGGQGNDVLVIPEVDFVGTGRLIGGNGTDTLRLTSSGLTLNLTTVADNRIVDIEQIDIRGTGSNSLMLDVQEVLNISSHSNTLTILQDTDDQINRGGGWTQQANETVDNQTFEVFTQGAATLNVLVPDTVPMAGNVDGDSDFDANDAFLIQLVQLAGSNSQINQSKGASSLSAGEIRASITAIGLAGDVDGDNDFDANDSFLIQLVKLAGSDTQIDQSKGASPLSVTQIRANVDGLGGGNSGERATASQRPRLAGVLAEPERMDSELFDVTPVRSTEAIDLMVFDDAFDATEVWTDFRSWIDAL